MYQFECNDKKKFKAQINSEYFEGVANAEEDINLDENIEKGMPIQDEDESVRTGSSL